jgi:uncharacterized protein (UPF0216 family)
MVATSLLQWHGPRRREALVELLHADLDAVLIHASEKYHVKQGTLDIIKDLDRRRTDRSSVHAPPPHE